MSRVTDDYTGSKWQRKWQRLSCLQVLFKPAHPRNRKTSTEVAPCALTQDEGAVGDWWEEETWSRATMAAVTICPAFMSFSGRGRNNWLPTRWPHTGSTNKAFITTGHVSETLVSDTLGFYILCLFNCESSCSLSGCTWESWEKLLHWDVFLTVFYVVVLLCSESPFQDKVVPLLVQIKLLAHWMKTTWKYGL